MITADCELWLDGLRIPDRAAQLEAGTPTALSALVLQWGRQDSVTQPDSATCRFTLYDGLGAESALGIVHVGMPVEVYATGITEGGQDYYPNPDASRLPLGPLSTDYYGADPDPGMIPIVIDTQHGRAVQVTEAPGVGTGDIWIPPLPFSSDPAAWDGLPQIAPGQTWQVSITARVPEGAMGTLVARTYTAPTPPGVEPPGVAVVAAPPIPGSATAPVTVTGTVTLPADRPASVWLALGLSVTLPGGPTWAAAAGTWSAHPETWQTYLAAELYRLQAITGGLLARRVLVFAGVITDAIAAPVPDDLDAVTLDLTAADISADLGADVLNGDPWPLESLGARVARIADASRSQVSVVVDDSLAPIPVSWRELDSANVLDLLRDLAQTAGGALWPSSHATTGGYLWLEDTGQRAALLVLGMVSGAITIVGGSGRDIDTLSACDVLRDPVQLSQTIAEITTTVTVGWKAQTLDDEGQPAPTDSAYTVTDEPAFDRYGLRSLRVDTELTTESDAAALANRTLAKSRAVTWKANGYTLDTAVMPETVPSVSNPVRMETLMDLLDGTTRIGQALTLTDQPAWLPSETARAYVEGGTYSYRDGLWILELTISPADESGASALWGDLPADWQWNEWDPSLSWAEIVGVGSP